MTNVFIVGVGRSGTSLLQSMLDSHSQISFLPETQFVRNYILNKANDQFYSLEEIQKRIDNDSKLDRISEGKWKAVFRKLNSSPASLKDVYEHLLIENAAPQNFQYYGDKDPRLLDYLDLLFEFYPKAKIIHIYRDPRDIILSKTKAEWSKSKPFWLHAIISQAQISRGRKIGLENFKENFIELKYEDLILHPENTLKELCQSLNLEFEPKMLNFQSASKKLVSTSEMQWKGDTFKPLMTTNIEKWRNEFSKLQVLIIEALSHEWFEALKYKRSSLGLLSKLMMILNPVFKLIYSQKL